MYNHIHTTIYNHPDVAQALQRCEIVTPSRVQEKRKKLESEKVQNMLGLIGLIVNICLVHGE